MVSLQNGGPHEGFQEKAQALIKRTVGQMISDDKLVVEGMEQERHAEDRKVQASTDPKSSKSESH